MSETVPTNELHRIVPTVLIYKNDPQRGLVYFLAKRAMYKKVMPGKWGTIGGGMSTSDYIHLPYSTEGSKQWYGPVERALRREVKEESNLEIGKPEFLTDLTFIRPDGVPVLCLSYFAPYKSEKVVLAEEHTECAWVTVEEATKYDLIDGILGEIREIDEILRKRKNLV